MNILTVRSRSNKPGILYSFFLSFFTYIKSSPGLKEEVLKFSFPFMPTVFLCFFLLSLGLECTGLLWPGLV